MRFPKNSFIFLETLLSILLLSGIIAIFIHLPLTKESSLPNIQTIENQFFLRDYTTHFSSQSKQLHFKKNSSQEYIIWVQQTTYNSDKVKLHAYKF